MRLFALLALALLPNAVALGSDPLTLPDDEGSVETVAPIDPVIKARLDARHDAENRRHAASVSKLDAGHAAFLSRASETKRLIGESQGRLAKLIREMESREGKR